MRKFLSVVLCFLVFISAAWRHYQKPLANENRPGLYARSIEQVLRLRESEVDLATAALIVSENWSDMVNGRGYITTLDNMAREIRERLEQKGITTDYRVIPEINKYLFDELGFKALSEANDPNSLFLHTVLDEKRGYCLSLSVLYLSLAERLGLPMYGVVVPGHFFVRYDDGSMQFNIETTGNGGTATDEQYIEKFNVPKASRDSIYLKNLNKIQTLGCFFNNLGNSYDKIGDIDSALKAYKKAVDINPSLSESRVNVGNIYLKQGEINKAIREYQKALRINASDATTHNNLGNAYTEQGRLGFAVSSYQRAINLDPEFIDSYKGLAIAYNKQERYMAAISTLKRAIAIAPKDANCYSQMGQAYKNMDSFNKAISYYNKALDIEPGLIEAYYGLAACYDKKNMVDDEILAYRNILSIQPHAYAAHVNLGNIYFGLERYKEAIIQYKQAVDIEPGEATLYYNLGAAYSNRKDYKNSVTQYLRAISIDSSIGDAHFGLAFGFYNLKDYESAWKHIKIAQKLGVKVSDDQLNAIKSRL